MEMSLKLSQAKIERLNLKHFRCYKEVDIVFHPHINLLTGGNAQGKTSLLEAIFLLSVGRSHRNVHDSDMITHGEDFSRIEGHITQQQQHKRLEMVLSENGKKARINHVEYRRLSDYVGRVHVVMFAPEDLQIVKGGPSNRRNFMDAALSQVNPYYVHHLSRYRKVLKERNEHLKSLQREDSKTLLDVFDERLAHYAEKIIKARKFFLQRIERKASGIYQAISREKAPQIIYEPSAEESDFKKKLLNKRSLDILAGSTSTGPHRDDCGFHLEERPFKKTASQGQTRTLALSMKLAEADYMREETNSPPIILLDDIFSELDYERQKNILKRFDPSAQIFITSTEVEHPLLESLKQYKHFSIQEGKIEGVSTHGTTSEL